jgi:hypothetical protein
MGPTMYDAMTNNINRVAGKLRQYNCYSLPMRFLPVATAGTKPLTLPSGDHLFVSIEQRVFDTG